MLEVGGWTGFGASPVADQLRTHVRCSTLAEVAVYEISLYYPDQDFNVHHKFLASVTGGPTSALQGFRQHGSGVVLTFVVDTDHGIDVATKAAIQRAAGLWPNARPVSTNVHVGGG